MSDPAQWVSVARIIRPQGRRGEVLAEILTDFPERFARMRDAFLDRRNRLPPAAIAIENAWLHKGRVVLKFSGVDSISDAEALRGAELVIPSAERVALDEDAAYIDDLAGCNLIDMSQPGHPSVGVVRDVIRQEGATDLLVVIAPDGTEHWIPFARAYLACIDMAARRLEMHLPPGLLEINAPLSDAERRDQAEHEGEEP